jgi:DNA-binding transcriptional regulator LsrR (DeoR family)
VLCHFIDEEGELISHPVNDRVVAVNPVVLRATREVILVSGGWEKLKAITAAMKLLRPSVLVVNELVAERLALGRT